MVKWSSANGARLLRSIAVACAAAIFVDSAPLAQPLALQGLTLQDHRERSFSADSLAGRPVLLHFVFTGCSSVCPRQVADLVRVHDMLPPHVRSRVEFVSVTVDPLADTPRAMAAFARRFGADRPGWRFATGDAVTVGRLIERMQVFDRRQGRTSPADHRDALWLFGADGALVQRFRGSPVDHQRLVDEIAVLGQARPQHAAARVVRSEAR